MGRNKTVPNAAGADGDMSESLARLFQNATVLDVGCGVGNYGHYFRAHSPAVSWTGIDGSEGIEEASHGLVTFADVAAMGLPRSFRRPWGWILSMQVAEHVAPFTEATFVRSLVFHAQRGVVLGWAGLAQQGLGHSNCQTPAYVACAMRFLGFEPSPQPRAAQAIDGMVFRKARQEAVLGLPPDRFAEAYFGHTRTQCGFTTWGYLAQTPRVLRQLTARRAILGVPFQERVCDLTPRNNTGMWRKGSEYMWWRNMGSEIQAVDALANRTFLGGAASLWLLEHALYDELALEEVSPASRTALRQFVRKERARQLGRAGGTNATSAVDVDEVQSLRPLRPRTGTATLALFHRWLNNSAWGMCFPPTEAFCFYSRHRLAASADSGGKPRAMAHKLARAYRPKDCAV